MDRSPSPTFFILTRFPLLARALQALRGDVTAARRAASWPEACALLRAAPAALVVVGAECLPAAPGQAIAALRAAAPQARLLVLSEAADASTLAALVRGGADGVLRYDAELEDVAAALDAVAAGATWLDPRVQIALLRTLDAPAPPPPALTARELEVLRGVARGLSNKAIGRELQLQEGTVKTYLRRLRQRMGARDRTHAVVHAMRIGLVDPRG